MKKRKRKKKKQTGEISLYEIIKSIRKPRVPGTRVHKPKSDYERKGKWGNEWNKDA
jgi:hypothetical protein